MNQIPVHVFATWEVKEGHLDTVLSLLSQAAVKSREEEGNLFYDIHQSNTDANTIILFEGYTSNEAVAEHRSSAHFQEIVVGKIVPLLESREVILTTPILG